MLLFAFQRCSALLSIAAEAYYMMRFFHIAIACRSEEEGLYDLGVRWRDLDMKKFLVIGSAVYLTESAVIYPFELVKTRQQVTTSVVMLSYVLIFTDSS